MFKLYEDFHSIKYMLHSDVFGDFIACCVDRPNYSRTFAWINLDTLVYNEIAPVSDSIFWAVMKDFSTILKGVIRYEDKELK